MKLVIVGGVAGGAAAAARARRLSEDAEILVFERGPDVSFANCGLPYFVGGEIGDRAQLLVQTPQALRRRFNLDVRVNSEVTAIDRSAHEVTVSNLKTSEEYREAYDKLILSPGAAPIRPPLPGVDLEGIFTVRTVPDAVSINEFIANRGALRAVGGGAGFIGLEMVENLKRRGLTVQLVEKLDQVLPVVDAEMAAFLLQELKRRGVQVHLSNGVTAIERDGAGLAVKLESGESLEADLVILSIGVKPETQLAKQAGLVLGERGGIIVNEYLQTSDPDIYAVGDAIETTDLVTKQRAIIPLAGPANKQGRIAADNALGRDVRYEGTQATWVVRVFDTVIATTGASEKTLCAAGIPHIASFTHSASHATYYPGSTMTTTKLLFSPEDGRLLGAQVVGNEGVDKRIDVLSTALCAGLTVYDLETLDLAYAPPFSSVRDPVNVAGFVASNILRGDVDIIHWHEVADRVAAGSFLLDVRTPQEVAAGHIPGSVNIPVDELRDRLSEVPKDKEILVYCHVGLRAYIAVRLLKQKGLGKVLNLSGGYRTYSTAVSAKAVSSGMCTAPPPKPASQPDVTNPQSSITNPQSAATACLDASGMQCPGPVVQMAKKLEELTVGDVLEVIATDSGFASDVPAWCHSTGNTLLSLERQDKSWVARVQKGCPSQTSVRTDARADTPARGKTMVVFSNDLDRVLAAFVIANGAASLGEKATMFFTFWGLNVLRKDRPPVVAKSIVERMFGWMMPRGVGKLKLSKMNMGGLGTGMMKAVMRSKGVNALPELISQAQSLGVKFVACTMSMEIMGLRREELIDGVAEGGVAYYLDATNQGNGTLFI